MPPLAHARLGASSAHRWLNCTRSVSLSANVPNTTSVYAEEGSAAHALCEAKARLKLLGGKKAAYKKELAAVEATGFYDAEMEDCADQYIQHLIKASLLYKNAPALYIESRVDYSAYAQGGFGTADCIITGEDTIDVLDFKYGKGVPVSAEDNPQLKLYGIGALLKFNPFATVVRLHVCQPRLNSFSTWETSVVELIKWAETEVASAAKHAVAGDEHAVAGDWCQFCPIKATCRARAKYVLDVESFPGYLMGAEELTMEEIGAFLPRVKQVKEYAKALEEYALQAALNGREVPGYKVVAGRGSRSFRDQAAAFKTITASGIDSSKLYSTPEPLSVAQVEKLVGRKKFTELIGDGVASTVGKPTLAPETDKRATYDPVGAVFEQFKIGEN